MPSGGPVALLYGFIFCVACNFALAFSLGELAAIWPTAGGQYHFVYALSSDRWKRFLVRPPLQSTTLQEANNLQSLCAGWINIAGWLTLVTTEAIFSGDSSLPKEVGACANWIQPCLLLPLLSSRRGDQRQSTLGQHTLSSLPLSRFRPS